MANFNGEAVLIRLPYPLHSRLCFLKRTACLFGRMTSSLVSRRAYSAESMSNLHHSAEQGKKGPIVLSAYNAGLDSIAFNAQICR